jgi:hypothetical protein
VPLRNDAAGTSSRPLSGNVVVQRDAVLQVERRRLSVWKTSLLGAFGAALAGYVLYDAFTDERPKPGEGGKPGPDEAPITLFRWGIAVGR